MLQHKNSACSLHTISTLITWSAFITLGGRYFSKKPEFQRRKTDKQNTLLCSYILQHFPHHSLNKVLIQQQAKEINNHKIPPEHKKNCCVFCLFVFYCEGSQIMVQANHRSCGVSILGDIQNPPALSPGQPALADPA